MLKKSEVLDLIMNLICFSIQFLNYIGHEEKRHKRKMN
ncbi:hypothetical protein NU08_3679 [Flavobacterium anhuiense]|uniref:Uncharacterized protein n=1 Tax=Flavobacterium anhuiense TaxID=459526 RepID=A0A444VVI1_9FLAO|nr:hypothetical protein NU08_3679 [Flavobacterium anhuiense]